MWAAGGKPLPTWHSSRNKCLTIYIQQFRPVPHRSFPSSANIDWQPNRLEIDIQPDEGISLRFLAKQPGVILQLSPRDMTFRYSEAFTTEAPEAYETLLLDVMEGDAT
jgi:glucose-6-phosphate 1-dehydrogenase